MGAVQIMCSLRSVREERTAAVDSGGDRRTKPSDTHRPRLPCRAANKTKETNIASKTTMHYQYQTADRTQHNNDDH